MASTSGLAHHCTSGVVRLQRLTRVSMPSSPVSSTSTVAVQGVRRQASTCSSRCSSAAKAPTRVRERLACAQVLKGVMTARVDSSRSSSPSFARVPRAPLMPASRMRASSSRRVCCQASSCAGLSTPSSHMSTL